MPRPLLLDLFCGAGGAAMGYYQAGFDVIGVDIEPQPSYPFPFFQADAMEFPLGSYDAIHASPPCQKYSDLWHRTKRDYPDYIAAIRERLVKWGGPFIIENVERSPLVDPIMLCGTMFPTLRVLRHRLFESNVTLVALPHKTPHPRVFTRDKRKQHYGKLDPTTAFLQVTGGGNAPAAEARKAMNIDWVRNREELNQMIPPPYTKYIGAQLRNRVDGAGIEPASCSTKGRIP